MSGAAGRFSRHQLSIVRPARRRSARTRRDTASSASELGEDLIRGDDLATLSFIVATDDRCVEARALVLVQIVAVVDDGQIDLRFLESVVGLVQLQPTLMNMRLEPDHDL
jgi:hypothetical protein